MIALSKKSSLLASAFFVLSLGLVDSAIARVNCYSLDESLEVTRSDVTKDDDGDFSPGAVHIRDSQSRLIINQSVDLDIRADLSRFDHSRLVKESDFVWEVEVTYFSGYLDYITANYQFNGLSLGDNKICSSPTSCIDVISVEGVGYYREPEGFWIFRRMITKEKVRLILDLSNAKESGFYRGNLEVELFRSQDRSGGGKRPLVCDN